MNITFRRNPGIAEALDACRHLQEKIERLATDAEILRRVREADCAGELLSRLRHRGQAAGTEPAADLGRQSSAITAELEAIRSVFARYDSASLEEDEAEILRLAYSTRSRIDALDAAGLAMRARAVKARAVTSDLSPAEIAALCDSADPWRLDAQ